MKVFDFIKQVFDLVGAFIKSNNEEDINLNFFSNWLDHQLEDTDQNEDYAITGHSIDAEIAAYIGRMSRYSNFYIKAALEELPFTTDMDFAFTAILHRSQPIGKTNLIKKMAYDKSSGMEVIKRLLKNGIIEQFPNPEDKRGKLLRLTKKGEENVILAYSEAGKAAKLVCGNLSEKEQQTLHQLLKKLDNFHYPIYLHEGKDIDAILKGYL